MSEPLIEIKNLRTHFFTDEGVAKAVDDVSLIVPEGQTLGLVGESGCGKSVTAYSIMRLIPDPPGRIAGGQILFGDKDIASLDEPAMRELVETTPFDLIVANVSDAFEGLNFASASAALNKRSSF